VRVTAILSSSSAIRAAAGAPEDAVRHGERLDGWTPLVVTVHGRARHAAPTIRVLRDIHAALTRMAPNDAHVAAATALRGCPFVVGTAVRDGGGDEVVFSAGYDIRADGLVTLDDITSDVSRLRAYQQLPLELRVANGQALANAYEHLERLRFVHHDLTGAHVVVRPRPRVPGATPLTFVDAAITGFDHGAVRAVRSGRHRERAQFAALLHRAVFGVAPAAAASVRGELLQLPEPLADAFRSGFPLTGRQWREVLAVPGTAPEFRALSVWPRGVVAGETVTVRWRAIPGREVRVDGVRGALPAEGEVDVVVRHGGPIRVAAVNAFGRTEAWTDTVRVFTPPTIAAVNIPRVPPIVINAPVVHAPMPELDVSADALARAVTDALRRRITVDTNPAPRFRRFRDPSV